MLAFYQIRITHSLCEIMIFFRVRLYVCVRIRMCVCVFHTVDTATCPKSFVLVPMNAIVLGTSVCMRFIRVMCDNIKALRMPTNVFSAAVPIHPNAPSSTPQHNDEPGT